MTKKKVLKVGPKRLKEIDQILIRSINSLNVIGHEELCAYIESHLKKMKFTYTPNFSVRKWLNDCVLLEDVDADIQEGLEENALKWDITVLLELNYDPALLGHLAGYKNGVIYIISDDWLYPMQLKELSYLELRHLALTLANTFNKGE